MEPSITDPPNSGPPPNNGPPWMYGPPVDAVHFLLPNSGQPPNSVTDQRCAPNDTFQYKITSDNGQVGGARVGGAQEKTPGHAFSFASRYSRCIRTLLAFGRESDPNSNCSRLAWPASCPSSSYPRRRDKRISRNAVAHAAIIIIIIIIIDYSHMPIRHKKKRRKGDIKTRLNTKTLVRTLVTEVNSFS